MAATEVAAALARDADHVPLPIALATASALANSRRFNGRTPHGMTTDFRPHYRGCQTAGINFVMLIGTFQ
jgi:hypothetical protein